MGRLVLIWTDILTTCDLAPTSVPFGRTACGRPRRGIGLKLLDSTSLCPGQRAWLVQNRSTSIISSHTDERMVSDGVRWSMPKYLTIGDIGSTKATRGAVSLCLG